MKGVDLIVDSCVVAGVDMGEVPVVDCCAELVVDIWVVLFVE